MRLIPALNLSANVNLYPLRVVRDGDIDGMSHAAPENKAALHDIGDSIRV